MSAASGADRPALLRQDGVGKVLQLRAADGAEVRVAAHGAHVLSWKTPDGIERLFLSGLAEFGGTAAIRGGIPVIFPQFAGEGPLPKHGFARNRPWQLIDARQPSAGPATASFQLFDDAATQAIWPQSFRAQLSIRVGGNALAVSLSITNTDRAPTRFTAALHSYLRVDAIADVRLQGLQGLRYRDTAAGGSAGTETAAALEIVGEVDRIYFDAPPALELVEPQRRLRVESAGFVDAVVWNPGELKAQGLPDLDRGGWQRFLCVESASIGRPVELSSGQGWQGSQTLIAG